MRCRGLALPHLHSALAQRPVWGPGAEAFLQPIRSPETGTGRVLRATPAPTIRTQGPQVGGKGRGRQEQTLPCPGPNVSRGLSKSLREREQGETTLPSPSACVPQPLKQICGGIKGLSAAWAATALLEGCIDVRKNHRMCVSGEFSEHPIQPPWVAAKEAEAQQGKGCGWRFQHLSVCP